MLDLRMLSRVSNIIHCRVDLFSDKMLLDILERIGFKICEKMQLDVSEVINNS